MEEIRKDKDGKIESKGVIKAETELQRQEQHNVIVIKLPEEEKMGEASKQQQYEMEPQKKE